MQQSTKRLEFHQLFFARLLNIAGSRLLPARVAITMCDSRLREHQGCLVTYSFQIRYQAKAELETYNFLPGSGNSLTSLDFKRIFCFKGTRKGKAYFTANCGDFFTSSSSMSLSFSASTEPGWVSGSFGLLAITLGAV